MDACIAYVEYRYNIILLLSFFNIIAPFRDIGLKMIDQNPTIEIMSGNMIIEPLLTKITSLITPLVFLI